MRPEYLSDFFLSLKVPFGAECFSASFNISWHQTGFLLTGGNSIGNSIESLEGSARSLEFLPSTHLEEENLKDQVVELPTPLIHMEVLWPDEKLFLHEKSRLCLLR